MENLHEILAVVCLAGQCNEFALFTLTEGSLLLYTACIINVGQSIVLGWDGFPKLDHSHPLSAEETKSKSLPQAVV